MKRRIFIVSVLIAVLMAFASCNNDTPSTPETSVTVSSIDIKQNTTLYEGDTYSLADFSITLTYSDASTKTVTGDSSEISGLTVSLLDSTGTATTTAASGDYVTASYSGDDGSASKQLTVTVITVQEVAAVYAANFGHVRFLNDLNDAFADGTTDIGLAIGTVQFTSNEDSTTGYEGTITVPLTLTEYGYDSKNRYLLATGTGNLVLSGTMAEDGSAFTATSYEFTNLTLTLSASASSSYELKSLAATAESVSGTFVLGNASGTEAASLELIDLVGNSDFSISSAAISDTTTPKFSLPVASEQITVSFAK